MFTSYRNPKEAQHQILRSWVSCPWQLGFTGLDVLQPPSGPLGAGIRSLGQLLCSLTHSLHYVFSFNAPFVPMALELGGRLKEWVVILSKVWVHATELSLGNERHWAMMAKRLDPSSWPLNPDSLLLSCGRFQWRSTTAQPFWSLHPAVVKDEAKEADEQENAYSADKRLAVLLSLGPAIAVPDHC